MTQQEVLLQHLIGIYREKGVPLNSLVDSSFYKALPLEERIKIIKAVGQNAKDKMGIDSGEVKKILLGLGLATLGLAAAGLSGKNYIDGQIQTKAKALAEGTKFVFSNRAIPTATILAGSAMFTAGAGKLQEAHRNYQDNKALKNMDLSNDNAILQHLIHREM